MNTLWRSPEQQARREWLGRQMRRHLTSTERRRLKLYVGWNDEPMSYREIAAVENVGHPRIYKAIRSAERKLRRVAALQQGNDLDTSERAHELLRDESGDIVRCFECGGPVAWDDGTVSPSGTPYCMGCWRGRAGEPADGAEEVFGSLPEGGWSILEVRPGADRYSSDSGQNPAFYDPDSALSDGWLAAQEGASEEECPFPADPLRSAWREGFSLGRDRTFVRNDEEDSDA